LTYGRKSIEMQYKHLTTWGVEYALAPMLLWWFGNIEKVECKKFEYKFK